MRILSLGAGGIGGYFAGRLAETEAADVTFLVRPARKAQIDRDGLRLESRLGDFKLKANTVVTEDIREPADFILLTCKAYDLDSAMAAIRPAVGPNTAVIPLLNGISHLDRLNATFGKDRVLGGVAGIAITMLPDGLIKHLNDWGMITFGEQDGTMSPRVTALKAAFDQCKGVTATASSNIMQNMWEKIVFLSTLAGMTTLMRANMGEIGRAPGGVEIALDLLARTARIAEAEGYPMPEAYMTRNRGLLDDKNSMLSASMMRDMERHGPVEADHIIGYLLDKARAHGINDTLHKICYANLKAYEQRREAGRL